MQFVGEALPSKGFLLRNGFSQQTGSPVVRHFGTWSWMLGEAHSSVLSRQEHPLATFQGSAVRALAHGRDFGHRTFVYLCGTGCALPRVKGSACFFFEFAITHKNRYFAFSHRFTSLRCQPSSLASLGGTCSPQPTRGNSADDGAHLTEFLFLKNVTLGKGFGPE